jgi:D-lactate dehydrogenase
MQKRTFDVFFFEAFEEEAEALRAHLPPHIKAAFTADTVQEWSGTQPDASVVSIRTQSLIPPIWAEAVDGILTRSTGYDHVVRYLASIPPPLPAGYLPLYCNRAVAEQAMLLWMALLRRLPTQREQFKQFHRDGITGRECKGKALAVFGVGNIGYEVARIGKGLGMRVMGVDVVERHRDVDFVPPNTALAEADVIVCAMNLTASNAGYFNAGCWEQSKPNALFINIARGELSPALDLAEALNTGRLGGAGLDVYDNEPELAVALRSGEPSSSVDTCALLALAQRSNVICTPHNAFNTAESVARKSEHSVQQIDAFLKTGTFLWPVPLD